ncbi:hypothetical protein [Brevundimonas diminuta]|uniref:hypothetical protein n=1 Tax=Brevundimonas diminuta TaxID=293 RepID=UPI0025A5712B|nr:hypothetical protein [Brevundimonas diminuta]MDM8352895.1 hypothetical protein [Brevundimonas diminuta]
MADFSYLPSAPVPGHGLKAAGYVIENSGTLATGALALNKTSALVRVPKGFKLAGVRFRIGDADSNGSATFAFTVGDVADPDRIITTSTAGQAGGEVTALADSGFLHEFAADTDIILTATTAAATAQAAAFKIALIGTLS